MQIKVQVHFWWGLILKVRHIVLMRAYSRDSWLRVGGQGWLPWDMHSELRIGVNQSVEVLKSGKKLSLPVHKAMSIHKATAILVGSFPGGSDGKESICQCRRHGFDPWVRKIPWRRKWQPTPVSLPGKSYGQRSLVGYSPWGHKRIRRNLETRK